MIFKKISLLYLLTVKAQTTCGKATADYTIGAELGFVFVTGRSQGFLRRYC